MTSFQSAPAFRNRPDLPSSEGEQASPPLARAEWPAAHAPGATILMIDDDEFVRLTTVRLLERSGYRVLTAADGDTGLELLQDHGATATAVLLDLGLPGRSGVSLLRHTRETNPGLPVLIASG